ncbi:MAG: glycosyltransferase family 2 protein [Clostridia bacterium]|nr:glycosyltransferase family 2 protein [Clostridia bacterium]
MIVKNEEAVLKRCLQSVTSFIDEIIIVDTGSNDTTKKIASQFTSKIYDFAWIDDFAAARNFSFSKASGDYIMWLDADDIVTPFNSNKILSLKNTYNPSTDIFMFKYNVAFDKNNKPTFTYYRERIIRNIPKYKWESPIHEVIPLIGNITYSDISIEHKKIKVNPPKRNLNIFNKMISEGIELDARQQFYYGRELFYNNDDIAAINTLEDFLKRNDGWSENKIDACKLLGSLYLRNNNLEKALVSLFSSFKYAEPRSNICCDIGKIFFDKKDYKNSIFWYELASSKSQNIVTNAFIEPDTFDYIPYMQLCVIYYRLGDFVKANMYNEMAGQIKPNDPNYLHNKNLFSNL